MRCNVSVLEQHSSCPRIVLTSTPNCPNCLPAPKTPTGCWPDARTRASRPSRKHAHEDASKKEHTGTPNGPSSAASFDTAVVTSTKEDTPDAYFPVVAIGASAGGLAALKTFFAHVPKDSGVAFVIVVHLSPEHESHLDEVLQPNIGIPVQQVTQTIALERNHAYVIPPNKNLDAIDTHLRLSDLEARRIERAPIDHFFRTLADTHGDRAIGVVLTGTGSDGTLGLRRIKERGGLTVVQDPTEAEYDGMPSSAIAAMPVDLVLPVGKIPRAILRYVETVPRLPLLPTEDEGATDKEAKQFLKKLFAIIQARTGRDFSHYKQSTLLRRISRRMQFHHVQEPSAYLELLRKNPDEIGMLADDILINVTNFFRDPDVFEGLEKNVIGRLFEGKKPGDYVRVWSVGCATGEEAYSLAILLVEHAQRLDAPPAIQVFASDLHKQSLERAREGYYSGEISKDVSPERLERFFQREDSGYRVKREVRELVVFAQHNVLADPPFSRLDLISCRNLFIYLDRSLHLQVIEVFHYALKPDGYLMLGTSETIDQSELFRVEDKKRSIFRRMNVAGPEPRLPVFSLGRSQVFERPPSASQVPEATAYGGIHQHMVEQYAPPSVLLSPDNHVVHFSAHAGRYFAHPGGSPTTNVFRLVRQELSVELKTAVSAARAQRKPVRVAPVEVRFNGEKCPVGIDVRPSLDPERDGFVLLIFDEQPRSEALEVAEPAIGKRKVSPAVATKMRQLTRAKEIVEERLQKIIKEYETGQEELRASNEELQSANEELRSTFEELETSKEELQSINEELQTVNQENRHKVEELALLSGDLQNLFAATDIATIFLDRELRILRFTPKTAALFNVCATDRGRPLMDFTHRLGYQGLEDDAHQVLDRLVPIEREVRDSSGRWYLMRVRPYRSVDDRIAGVVVTFVDITVRKQIEDDVRRAKEYSEHIIETLPEPLLILNADLMVKSANAAFFDHFNVRPEETRGRKIYDLGNGQWNIPSLRDLLEKVLPENKVFNGYLVDHVFESLGRRVMLVNGRRLDSMQLILLGFSDITERHEAEQALRQAQEHLAVDLDAMSTLQRLGALFIAEGNLETILDEIVSAAVAITGANFGSIQLFDPETGSLDLVAQRGFEPWWVDHWRHVSNGEGACGAAIERSERVIVEDIETSPIFVGTPALEIQRRAGVRAVQSTPLLSRSGRLLGMFSTHWKAPGRPSERTLRLLDLLARQASDIITDRAQAKGVHEAHLRLIETDRRKDEFLAMLSHELRNPLTPIRLGLHMLERAAPGSEQAKRAKAVIDRQVEHLTRLVEDLLDVTRVTSGKIELQCEVLDVNELVERTVDDHRSAFVANGVELEMRAASGQVWVNGDRTRLAQVIGNLLQNSCKFTPRGGRTTVSVEGDVPRGQAVVRVKDTGRGIAPAMLPRLFEPFTQADASLDRSKGGLGLGLAVVKGLVEMHGGRVWGESEGLGKGAVFTMTLPLEAKPAVTEAPRVETSEAIRRVLIIEDNADAADTMKGVLELEGHAVEVASTGAEGLAKARAFGPEVVFCDIGLPGMDGYEVARAIRADLKLSGAKLVALTGYATRDDVAKAKEAGFDDHLAKPPSLESLERVLVQGRS